MGDDIEDFNSPSKVKARQEAIDKEKEKLDADFETNGYTELVSDILEPLKNDELITEKDIKGITDKLKTNYKGEEKGFDLNNELKNVILGVEGNNFVFEKVEMKSSQQKYKKATIEYSEKVWEKIENNEGIVEKGQENNKKITEIVKTEVISTSKEVGTILEKPENNIEQTGKDKIQARLGLDDKQINEKLNTTPEREKNLNNAKEIFFTKEKISEYSQNPKSQSSKTESLKDLGESIIKGEKIIDDDLENILENFLIDSGEENVKKYSLENPEEVNEALNNAFEIEIEKILDGKVNYNTETIDNLKEEILNSKETNPLEKLEKFKKIKTEVNTKIGSLAKKREKATSGKEKEKLKNRLKEITKEAQKIKPEKNPKKAKELTEEYKKITELLKEKPKSGEVMGGGKNDAIKDKVPVPETK